MKTLTILKEQDLKRILYEYSVEFHGKTDFATTQGATQINGKNWWIQPADDKSNPLYTSFSQSGVFTTLPQNREIGIRPVIELSSIKDTAKEVDSIFGCPVYEYGEYPTEAVASKSMAVLLENLYTQNKLSKTGKVYTADATKFKKLKRNIFGKADGKENDYSTINQEFIEEHFEEFYYQGKKFIRVKTDPNGFDEHLNRLEDRLIEDKEVIWIEVKPIRWLQIDENKLISEKVLISGIPYSHKEEQTSYEESTINFFLENYMSKEIEPLEIYLEDKKTKEEKKDKQEAEILIDKIRDLISKNNDPKVDPGYLELTKEAESELKNIIDDYNKRLDSLVNNDGLLTLEANDESTLKINLLVKLEMLFDKLNSYKKKTSDYYKLIDILENKQTEETIHDELYFELRNLSNVILPFIKGEKVVEEYKTFIEQYIIYLKEQAKKFEPTNLDNLKIEFRKKLYPYLVKIDEAVKSASPVDEVVKSTAQEINYNYEKPNRSLFAKIYKEIQNIIANINAYGTSLEITRSDAIRKQLDDYIASNPTVDSSIDQMEQFLMDLTRIEVEMNIRLKKQSKISSMKIS